MRVKLYGELRRKYFREMCFDVASVREAIAAIIANFPEFERDLRESESRSVTYAVRHDAADVPEDKLSDPLTDGLLQIFPVIQGSKGSNILTTVAGIALLVAGVMFGSPMLMLAGASLLYTSLFPPAGAPEEQPENTPSGIFNGAVNTVQQGHCVPLGYGKILCGSAVISSGLETADRFSLVSNPSVARLNP